MANVNLTQFVYFYLFIIEIMPPTTCWPIVCLGQASGTVIVIFCNSELVGRNLFI